jgi:hypothetical protein
MPMSLLLWTKTSEKGLVKRRFFESYPQAVSVVELPHEAPAPRVAARV